MKLNPLLLVSIVALAAGCGGSSPSNSDVPAGRGIGTLTIHWPERARVVPGAANSITVNLLRSGGVVATQTIPRPEGPDLDSTTTFAGLAYGNYVVDVAAFPTNDGTATDPNAVAQAKGRGSMTASEDVPGTATVTMASTVSRLSISPTTMDKGQSIGITASASNAAGEIVLLSAGGGSETLEWSTGASTIATVAGNGPTATLTGVHSGNTTVKAVLKGTDGSVVATSPSTSVKVNAIDDGTGTVIVK